jgi:ribosomal protein L7/L12
MATAAFISHSSIDRKVAETICEALENRGISCWLACRDVGPGENFQEAIVHAIRAAKVMVLIFTAAANNSNEIKKELALASRYNLTVIPVRMEDIVPSDAFELELATRQWIDFFGDWEHSIERLAKNIQLRVGTPTGASAAPAVTTPPLTPAIQPTPGPAKKSEAQGKTPTQSSSARARAKTKPQPPPEPKPTPQAVSRGPTKGTVTPQSKHQERYDVVLTEASPNKAGTIKALTALLECSDEEAADMIENAPSVVVADLDLPTANLVFWPLNARGGVFEIRRTGTTPSVGSAKPAPQPRADFEARLQFPSSDGKSSDIPIFAGLETMLRFGSTEARGHLTIATTSTTRPGSDARVVVRLESVVEMAEGQPFQILEYGALIANGIVTETNPAAVLLAQGVSQPSQQQTRAKRPTSLPEHAPGPPARPPETLPEMPRAAATLRGLPESISRQPLPEAVPSRPQATSTAAASADTSPAAGTSARPARPNLLLWAFIVGGASLVLYFGLFGGSPTRTKPLPSSQTTEQSSATASPACPKDSTPPAPLLGPNPWPACDPKKPTN